MHVRFSMRKFPNIWFPYLMNWRISHPEEFCKKPVLKISQTSQNLQENNCAGVYFFSLQILQNLLEQGFVKGHLQTTVSKNGSSSSQLYVR